jgi:2'-5' RNA ligase
VRLFVAIDLDETLRRAVADVATGIRRSFEHRAGGARVSWTAVDRMHVTVHFLGEVAEQDVSVLAEAFRRPLPVEAFDLEIGTAGTFPARGRPRVVWLGVAAKREALARVHQVTGEWLASLGVAVDPAPFNPHLTIGRLRSPVRVAAAAAALEGAPRRIGACRVDAVTLYESRLGRPGATYVAQASAPLSGSTAQT